MPEDPLLDSVWNALHTVHAHFALRNGPAVRYPADVVPFAAMAKADHSDLSPLAQLLAPAERVYLIGSQPKPTKNLQVGPALDCFQMLFPAAPHANAAPTDTPILRMTSADAPAMVALTDLAFPGFFRARTQEMGTYYGIRINDELVRSEEHTSELQSQFHLVCRLLLEKKKTKKKIKNIRQKKSTNQYNKQP